MRIYKHGGSSKYRGVCWNRSAGAWQVQIRNGTRVHHLGYFPSEILAAKRHDEGALQLKGTDAKLNFSLGGEGGEMGKYKASEAEVKAFCTAAAKVKGVGEPQRLTGAVKTRNTKKEDKKEKKVTAKRLGSVARTSARTQHNEASAPKRMRP